MTEELKLEIDELRGQLLALTCCCAALLARADEETRLMVRSLAHADPVRPDNPQRQAMCTGFRTVAEALQRGPTADDLADLAHAVGSLRTQ